MSWLWPGRTLRLTLLLSRKILQMSANLDRLTASVDSLHNAVATLIAANADTAAKLKDLSATHDDADGALASLADKLDADTAAATAAVAPAV